MVSNLVDDCVKAGVHSPQLGVLVNCNYTAVRSDGPVVPRPADMHMPWYKPGAFQSRSIHFVHMYST